MKRINKLSVLLLSSAIFALTSCGGNKVTNFSSALDYVAKNYDKYSYTNVKGKYTVSIDNLGVDLSYSVRNEVGYVTSGDEKIGINGVKLSLDNLPGVCLNSSYLNYVNAAYCQFGAITAEFVTKLALDLGYTIENGGLKISLTDNGGEDGLFDILKCAFPALNTYYLVTHIGKKDKIKNINTNAAVQFTESMNAIAQKNAPINLALNTAVAVTSKLTGGFSGDDILDIIDDIAEYGVGMNPNSKASGLFALNVGTDNEGFINNLSIELKAYDLDLNLTTGCFFTMLDPDTIPFYAINVTGSLAFKVSVSANFK